MAIVILCRDCQKPIGLHPAATDRAIPQDLCAECDARLRREGNSAIFEMCASSRSDAPRTR